MFCIVYKYIDAETNYSMFKYIYIYIKYIVLWNKNIFVFLNYLTFAPTSFFFFFFVVVVVLNYLY